MSTISAQTIDQFLAMHGTRVVADITAERDADGNSPLVVVRHGRFAAVLALMPFSDNTHLCIDVYPFADGTEATAGVFGMSDGQRWCLPAHGPTSHGWPSAHLIAVLVGEQAG